MFDMVLKLKGLKEVLLGQARCRTTESLEIGMVIWTFSF
jgi:hypothetical protein